LQQIYNIHFHIISLCVHCWRWPEKPQGLIWLDESSISNFQNRLRNRLRIELTFKRVIWLLQSNLSITTTLVFHNFYFRILNMAFWVKQKAAVCSNGATFHSGALPGDWKSLGSAPEWEKDIDQVVVMDMFFCITNLPNWDPTSWRAPHVAWSCGRSRFLVQRRPRNLQHWSTARKEHKELADYGGGGAGYSPPQMTRPVDQRCQPQLGKIQTTSPTKQIFPQK
jgi:hypothetical protein